ncbi:hypothetical protein AB0H29_08525 [Streptomyces thermolilacinus]
MPVPLPSVGRIVHYLAESPGGVPQCQAAVITEVGDYPPDVPEEARHNVAVPVGLAVLAPPETMFRQGVMQSEIGREVGTWHWPERV